MPAAAALPVDCMLGELQSVLAAGTAAVLVAPPGAGKTTRVPLALLAAGWLEGGRVVVLEPRRLAARAAAEYMARSLGEKPGGVVGLRARLASKVSARTRIEVVTEGVFTRMIIDDPALTGIGAVLFDEFHERSLEADLGLALALDARSGLRADLRILVMSATLDAARVAALLDEAPVLRSEGRAFPVETRYLGRDPGRRIEEEMAAAIGRALAEENGSVLAFLPGQREIRRVAERLSERFAGRGDVEVVPLHGSLGLDAQRRAIAPAPPGRRKVVLATSVAETSLTIEGVRIVVDSGLARVARYDAGTGLGRLVTVRVSRASADQRRGRAGRIEPGVCYRLWDEPATRSLAPFPDPEIRSADLAGLVLDCAAWGVSDPARLQWLDPPPASACAAARLELHLLGALDEHGRITALGRRLRALPLPPRIARMLIESAAGGGAQMAAEVAAILVERGLGGDDTDLEARLAAFRRDRSAKAADMRRLAVTWGRAAAAPLAGSPRPPQQSSPPQPKAATSAAALLALAFPDRIAKARGERGQFLLANGRGAMLDAHDPLAGSDYLAVGELQGSAAAGRIVLAARLEERELAAVSGNRIVEVLETSFDPAAAALRTRRVRRLGALVLASDPRPPESGEVAAGLLAAGIAGLGLARLPWPQSLLQVRARVAFLRRLEGEPWPDLSDAALAATARNWLAPVLIGKTSLAEIASGDLTEAMEGLLDRELRRRLDQAVPTHFAAPSGRRHPIDYTAPTAPALHIRVQELFGLDRHPTVGAGKLPLTLHLLSPAQRPIQVTRDLPGFWRGSWSAVRSEMRGRYPKHPWPDDPARAVPAGAAKPRAR